MPLALSNDYTMRLQQANMHFSCRLYLIIQLTEVEDVL